MFVDPLKISFYLVLLILELPFLPTKQPLLNGGGEGEPGAGTLQEVLQHPIHCCPTHCRAHTLQIHFITPQQAEWWLQVALVLGAAPRAGRKLR